jgi:hypothetical protein
VSYYNEKSNVTTNTNSVQETTNIKFSISKRCLCNSPIVRWSPSQAKLSYSLERSPKGYRDCGERIEKIEIRVGLTHKIPSWRENLKMISMLFVHFCCSV